MAQGDPKRFARNRTLHQSPVFKALSNAIVRSRREHQLTCGCLLDRGVLYHRVVGLYGNQFHFVKGHAGPCPKSGVIN